MAVPIISSTTSVLGYDRGDLVNYQPYASETPTSWSASELPAGVTIHASTGLISGTADDPGVYVVAVTATNGTGDSAAFEITIGIGQGDLQPDGIGIDLDVELSTGAIALAGLEGGGDSAPSLFVKSGDQLLLDIGFWKDDSLQDLPITSVAFVLREFEGEGNLTLSDGAFLQQGDGPDTRFRILVDFDKTAIDNALSSYEGDIRTSFLAIAEIEWDINHGDASLAPSVATRTSQTFRVVTDREMIA